MARGQESNFKPFSFTAARRRWFASRVRSFGFCFLWWREQKGAAAVVGCCLCPLLHLYCLGVLKRVYGARVLRAGRATKGEKANRRHEHGKKGEHGIRRSRSGGTAPPHEACTGDAFGQTNESFPSPYHIETQAKQQEPLPLRHEALYPAKTDFRPGTSAHVRLLPLLLTFHPSLPPLPRSHTTPQ